MSSKDTALHRTAVSAPLVRLVLNGDIQGRTCNWGSGRASFDTWIMSSASGQPCTPYDPHFEPLLPEGRFDTIYCGYVLNVLNPWRRDVCVEMIMDRLSRHGVAFFAVRADKINGEPYADGVITSRDTFQKSFTTPELRGYLERFFPNVEVKRYNHYILARCY